MAGLADVPFSVDLALADRWMGTGLRCTDMGLLAMLARAFINTAGLLMLAFDFTFYGEQIERWAAGASCRASSSPCPLSISSTSRASAAGPMARGK